MARTSSYSKFLQPVEAPAVQMPGWVLGGDYGDISKRILQEEVTRAQLEAQQLAQDTNELRLREAQESEDFRNKMKGRITPEMPMRDAYETLARGAIENGRVDDYMQIRNAQLREEQQKRNDRIQALTTAPRLAQSGLGQEALALLADQGITAPDNFIEANLKRERGLGGSVRVYNPETGEYEMLIAPQTKTKTEKEEKEILAKDVVLPDGSIRTVTSKSEYNKLRKEMGAYDANSDVGEKRIADIEREQRKKKTDDAPGFLQSLKESLVNPESKNAAKAATDVKPGAIQYKMVGGERVKFVFNGAGWERASR